MKNLQLLLSHLAAYKRHRLQLISDFLALKTDAYPAPRFEKLSDIEAIGRRTNFDFCLRCPQGDKLFFEVKYTERQFGKAADDLEHKEKFERTYLPLLQSSPFLVDRCKDRPFFLANYQILRNLVHAGPKARIVFLLPFAGAPIATGLQDSLRDLLTDSGKEFVQTIFLEETTAYFMSHCANSELIENFQAFRQKYLPSIVLSSATG